MRHRKNIMLGTAGHVDHGKTALVKLLTGCDTDTLAEERQRGLTIDLGFAPCRLADERIVGIVDVPGHVDFLRNMVAGAHGIDVVLFVVAADDGIMPQTHEHLQILTLMGLRHGVVALTKIDLVDAARREAVVADLRQMLAHTFLANAPICPVSNITGEGYDGFFDALNTVVNACADRPCRGLFRMWVEDVFTIRGAGTIVTGIPTSGVVRPGQSLLLQPDGRESRVRRLQVYGQDATEGRAGECVALNLPELDHETVRRGMVLCESDAFTPVKMLEAELRVLESLSSPLKDNQEGHLHVGTAAGLARVAMLESRETPPGQTQMVQLRLRTPLVVVPGDRFVLRANVTSAGRSGLTTVGGGRILGLSNVKLRRNKPPLLTALRARRDALDDPPRWAELVLAETARPVSETDLQRLWLSQPDESAAMLAQLKRAGGVKQTAGGGYVHVTAVERTAERIQSAVQAFHAAHPQRAGLGRDELLVQLGAEPELFDLAVAGLLQSQQLEQSGTVFARAGWSARLSDHEAYLCDQAARAYEQAGWLSPTEAEVAAKLGETQDAVAKAVRLLIERGVLVRLDARVIMHRAAVEAGKDVALRLFRRAPTFTTMAFRDALGVSRKFAVPLLDYLDKIRFTVRAGHTRTPGPEAKKFVTVHVSGASGRG